MGTFILKPTLKTAGDEPTAANDSLPNDFAGWCTEPYPGSSILDIMLSEIALDLLNAVVRPFNAPSAFSDTLRFEFTGNSIYLDGSPTPISFAGLPSGFVATSAQVVINVDAVGTGGNPVDGIVEFWLQKLAGDDGLEGLTTYNYDFVTLPVPTMLDIVNNGVGFRVNLSQVPANPGVLADIAVIGSVYNLRVEGTYTSDFYQFTLDPPSGSTTEVGQQITIASPGSDPEEDLNLNEVTLLIDGTEVIPDYQDEWWLIFTIPDGVDEEIEIEVVGNGTQFSGSVLLGVLTVLLIAASGMYTLIPNKTNDTLYSSLRDGTSRDVKIPNPFGKTGFIGG